MAADFHHVPVMLEPVLEALDPQDGQVLVDCTLGGGGHTRAILEAADCRVVGIDRDPAALAAARQAAGECADRLITVRGQFGDVLEVLQSLEVEQVDGILADLGVSSHQLDTPERGFSFRQSGPVDMRMDPDATISAATVVNEWPQDRLADVLYQFGEERRSRAVAAAIVAGRPWEDTADLAHAIARVVGRSKGRKHPATRSFQAIRIAVNDELGQLDTLLRASLSCLAPGGRMAILTFHSLEDRAVKRFLADHSGRNLPRDGYGNPVGAIDFDEVRSRAPERDDPNPRARSARLRSARKLP